MVVDHWIHPCSWGFSSCWVATRLRLVHLIPILGSFTICECAMGRRWKGASGKFLGCGEVASWARAPHTLVLVSPFASLLLVCTWCRDLFGVLCLSWPKEFKLKEKLILAYLAWSGESNVFSLRKEFAGVVLPLYRSQHCTQFGEPQPRNVCFDTFPKKINYCVACTYRWINLFKSCLDGAFFRWKGVADVF